MTNADMPEKIHHGKNIRRFREMLDMKQEGLAIELGGDWTQRKVSLLEAKETIDLETLEQVAKAMKIPVKAIERLSDEAVVSIIAETVNNHDQSASVFYNSTINPVDKWLEALEEIKRLNVALLKEKDEKILLMERMLGNKRK